MYSHRLSLYSRIFPKYDKFLGNWSRETARALCVRPDRNISSNKIYAISKITFQYPKIRAQKTKKNRYRIFFINIIVINIIMNNRILLFLIFLNIYMFIFSVIIIFILLIKLIFEIILILVIYYWF